MLLRDAAVLVANYATHAATGAAVATGAAAALVDKHIRCRPSVLYSLVSI
jgi:hypothetical protein